jgi:hypothetical protein
MRSGDCIDCERYEECGVRTEYCGDSGLYVMTVRIVRTGDCDASEYFEK